MTAMARSTSSFIPGPLITGIAWNPSVAPVLCFRPPLNADVIAIDPINSGANSDLFAMLLILGHLNGARIMALRDGGLLPIDRLFSAQALRVDGLQAIVQTMTHRPAVAPNPTCQRGRISRSRFWGARFPATVYPMKTNQHPVSQFFKELKA
jgi:hypothetical protein